MAKGGEATSRIHLSIHCASLLFLFFSLFFFGQTTADGVEAPVTSGAPLDSAEARWEWTRQAILRDFQAKPQRLFDDDSDGSVVWQVHSGSAYNGGYFTVEIGVGTPPQKVLLSVDTASGLSWVQCQACSSCYDPSQSATKKPVTCADPICHRATPQAADPGGCSGKNSTQTTCTFNTVYSDGSTSQGEIVTDSLSFGDKSAGDFYIGCGDAYSGLSIGAVGMIGLGMGPTNAAYKWGGRMFYRLPNYLADSGNFKGILCLGKRCRTPPGSVVSKFMPTPFASSMYSLRLASISVGNETFAMPSSRRETKTVTVIQTGTFITRLVKSVYKPFRDSFIGQVSDKSIKMAEPQDMLDTCFDMDVGRVTEKGLFPPVLLNFRAGQVRLSSSAVVAALGERLACLAFAPTDDRLNIIGGFQQQGLLVSFDLYTHKIAFLPAGE